MRFDVVVHADGLEVLGQDVVRKAGLLLVQIDGHDLELHGRTLLQLAQNVQQRIAVFAARHADHDLVAVFNHVEVHHGAAYLAAQAFFKLDLFALNLDLAGLGFGGSFALGSCLLRFFGNPGVFSHSVHGVHHCPVSTRMATSQSSKISSLVIFTRTPCTPGKAIKCCASVPVRRSSRSV